MSYLQTITLSSLLGLGLSLGLGLPSSTEPHVSQFLGTVVSATPTSISSTDQKRLSQILKQAQQQKLAALPMGIVVQTIARQFIGAPYQAGLLDRFPQEQLFISLERFDCVLLIESVLALSRNVIHQDSSPTSFAKNIEAQRYRTGHRTDYCSRLHYFSDWIEDGERRGLVKNLTATLGGIPLNKPLNFMTQHRSSYRQLQNDAAFTCLQQVEAHLNQRSHFYIPTAKIRSIYPQLQAGDIVAVSTSVPGLDVTHTGFIEQRSKTEIGFIHASPAGYVTRSPDLQTYVGRVEGATGIIVTRAYP